MPAACPRCGATLHRAEGRGGLALREHVVSREAAARPRTLRVAVGHEHRRSRRVAHRSAHRAEDSCRDYADVYALKAEHAGFVDQHVGARRRQEIRAPVRREERREGRSAQIDRSRANELWRLIYGLGIRHVGERAAQVLADAFGSMDALGAAPPWSSCRQTHEIGPVLADSVRSWFDEPRNRQLVDRLRAAGVRMEVPPERTCGRPAIRAAHRPHLRPDRHPSVDDARRGDHRDRTAWRKGGRVGQQEDHRA